MAPCEASWEHPILTFFTVTFFKRQCWNYILWSFLICSVWVARKNKCVVYGELDVKPSVSRTFTFLTKIPVCKFLPIIYFEKLRLCKTFCCFAFKILLESLNFVHLEIASDSPTARLGSTLSIIKLPEKVSKTKLSAWLFLGILL